MLGGIDFLRSVRSGDPVQVGPRVTVIGGGNVAIDVALTALRQGAQRLDLVSLEKVPAMTASPNEIESAVSEGVQLHPGWGTTRIDGGGQSPSSSANGPSTTAASDPQSRTHRLLILEAAQVILAPGQGTDLVSWTAAASRTTTASSSPTPRPS